jgi:hypothetical protein
VAGVDHVLVLLACAAFGLERVADDLVVGPPLATLDVFCGGVYLNVAVSCWAGGRKKNGYSVGRTEME